MSEPLYTIGHGPEDSEDILAGLLTSHGVVAVVDVRTLPESKRYPRLSGTAMAEWFPAHGVAYSWDKRLGGWRKAPVNSLDTALRRDALAGYAAHMRTQQFRDAMKQLLAKLAKAPTAVLCAETLWWRCHRRMIADYAELVLGKPTWHIGHSGNVQRHRPMEVARLSEDGTQLFYDAGQTSLVDLQGK